MNIYAFIWIPLAKHKNKLILCTLLLLVASLWTGVATTGKSQFCASCHSMHRFGQTWRKQKAHSSVPCVDCHLPSGFPERYVAQVSQVVKDWLAVGNRPYQFKTSIPNENCTQSDCHGQEEWDLKAEQRSRPAFRTFRHHPHFSKDIHDGKPMQCTHCHGRDQAMQPSSNAKHFDVLLDNCFPCHSTLVSPDHDYIIEEQANEGCLTNCHDLETLSDNKGHRLTDQDKMACHFCHPMLSRPRFSVSLDDCFPCHPEEDPVNLDRPHAQLHSLHGKESLLECIDCHILPPHRMNPLQYLEIECGPCHEDFQTRFLLPGLMYMGPTGRPDPMALAGVPCGGCHIQRSKGCTDGSHSCRRCHDGPYEKLVPIWQETITPRLERLEKGFEKLVTENWLKVPPARLEQFKEQLLGDGSRGVHNIMAFRRLVRLNTEWLHYCNLFLHFIPTYIMNHLQIIEYSKALQSLDGAVSLEVQDAIPENPVPKTEADPEPNTERINTMPNQTMRFKNQLVLGEPVKENCTVYCHINFPFSSSDNGFRHDTHSPERGFSCTDCHGSEPLEARGHGRLLLNSDGCTGCHHDGKRFPACHTCHETVGVVKSFRGIRFDHEIHAYGPEAIACGSCHINLKEGVETSLGDRCIDCHHKEQKPPAPCTTCHKEVLSAGAFEPRPNFDHGVHAMSRFMKNRCRNCHQMETGPVRPDLLSCDACHHPLKPTPEDPQCTVCHPVDQIAPAFQTTPFSHAQHGLLRCEGCHGMNQHRSPTLGMDCGRCHHLVEGNCRTCHRDPLVYVQTLDPSSSIPGVEFIHADHEKGDNCVSCHQVGGNIRKGFAFLSCADCHHQEGHAPSCATCHGTIDGIRAGVFPGSEPGAPDRLHSYLECVDCHRYDPSAFKKVVDGTGSCTQCHPEEYADLFEDMQRVLQQAFKHSKTPVGTWTQAEGFHNLHRSLELLKEEKR